MRCFKVAVDRSQSIDLEDGPTSGSNSDEGKRCPWKRTYSRVDRDFLILIRDGSEEDILEYLEANSNLNLDMSALQGQRALEVAVTYRSLSVLKLLLSHSHFGLDHLRCAMIEAVVENEIDMLNALLDTYEKREDGEVEGTCQVDGPASLIPASNVTAIMKAATLGNMDITRMLLDRGYSIKKPHHHRCFCEECIKKNEKGERLSESIARINAYRALASPVYIILTSQDAILTAFRLSHELHQLAWELPEHQSAYQELSQQCSKFAADLLNQCCDTREVQLVLKQKKGYPDPRPHQFSRLRLAILYEQKEFVAHPSCQQVLRSMWTQGLSAWWSWTAKQQLCHAVKHAFLFPFICFASVLLPLPFVRRRIEIPLNKFIYSAASYLLFLALLLSTLMTKTSYDPRQPTSWTEITVGIWILGHTWELLVNLFLLGFKTFLRSWWAVYDLILFGMFLLAEFLWFVTFLLVHYQRGVFPVAREEWTWYHPYLIGEGVYAIASILAFMRLLLWYQLHSQLGTLSISLRYMIGDVARFLLLILIIMFAFVVGINSLYGDYQEVKVTNEDGSIEQQNADFVTVKRSVRTVFWALFGMGTPESTDLVMISRANSTMSVHHVFTEILGTSLWGIYHIITVVVLINMLIAMLSDSYQKVQNNADREWKFARSSILLHFLDKQSAIPPPFNLIPTVQCVTSIARCVLATLSGRLRASPYHLWQRCFVQEKQIEQHLSRLEDSYQNLLAFLVQRYLHNERSLNEKPSEIPQDVLDRLKLDIMEDLKRTMKKEFDKGRERSCRRSTLSGSSTASGKV